MNVLKNPIIFIRYNVYYEDDGIATIYMIIL